VVPVQVRLAARCAAFWLAQQRRGPPRTLLVHVPPRPSGGVLQQCASAVCLYVEMSKKERTMPFVDLA